MEPKVKIAVIVGFTGIAVELLIFFSTYLFVFFNLIAGKENEKYFGGYGAIFILLIGCIAAGYFSAGQEKTTTRFDRVKAGAFAGIITGVMISFLPVIGLISTLMVIQQLSGGTTPTFNIGSPETTFCGLSIIMPIVIGSFLGAIGGFMAFPYTTVDRNAR